MKKLFLSLLSSAMIIGMTVSAQAVLIKKEGEDLQENNRVPVVQAAPQADDDLDAQIEAMQERVNGLNRQKQEKARQDEIKRKQAALKALLEEAQRLEDELNGVLDNSAPLAPLNINNVVPVVQPPLVQPVQKPSLFEVLKTWTVQDFQNNRYGGSFASPHDVYAFFRCAPLHVTQETKRSLMDQICSANINATRASSNFNRMHEDRIIDAILMLVGRTDLRRGASTDGSPPSQLAFDALMYNDAENRLFTLNEMGWLGYNLDQFQANYLPKIRQRRSPFKYNQFFTSGGGNRCTNFGCTQVDYPL